MPCSRVQVLNNRLLLVAVERPRMDLERRMDVSSLPMWKEERLWNDVYRAAHQSMMANSGFLFLSRILIHSFS